ncbi:MAG: hypothetical protein BM557_01200 [Flavobacterium sp. MedPE-SWcel]|uniref:hypothetical protein n=1 Tax=uncultured Flavobacterium sp. TaxID=165435 RepID=UPI000923B698|nr:hypothetical protein [uncultured Flavobacterium sp.]OIQ22024.1 MAG: hypothetical protein BM557_01200 [Flavobacterium sp. MedPE-SWcel]
MTKYLVELLLFKNVDVADQKSLNILLQNIEGNDLIILLDFSKYETDKVANLKDYKGLMNEELGVKLNTTILSVSLEIYDEDFDNTISKEIKDYTIKALKERSAFFEKEITTQKKGGIQTVLFIDLYNPYPKHFDLQKFVDSL